MDPYTSPNLTHYRSFHFLFIPSFPANQKWDSGNCLHAPCIRISSSFGTQAGLTEGSVVEGNAALACAVCVCSILACSV